jgi:hypothetical protein
MRGSRTPEDHLQETVSVLSNQNKLVINSLQRRYQPSIGSLLVYQLQCSRDLELTKEKNGANLGASSLSAIVMLEQD